MLRSDVCSDIAGLGQLIAAAIGEVPMCPREALIQHSHES